MYQHVTPTLRWQIPTMPTEGHSLHWRHNGHDSVSNHQPHDCLLNRLFRRRSKKISKLRVTGLCAGNSPETGEFPHKWPVTRKMFPFDGVIMCYKHDTRATTTKLWMICRIFFGLKTYYHSETFNCMLICMAGLYHCQICKSNMSNFMHDFFFFKIFCSCNFFCHMKLPCNTSRSVIQDTRWSQNSQANERKRNNFSYWLRYFSPHLWI